MQYRTFDRILKNLEPGCWPSIDPLKRRMAEPLAHSLLEDLASPS